jgi:hypothetical protein
MTQIFIDGKDIKDIKMTQNGKGQYISRGKTYYDTPMKDFEYFIANKPAGYVVHNDGSHQTTAARKAQRAIDISSLGKATATEDFKITGVLRDGVQSYIKGNFNTFGEVWFVHAYKVGAKVGQVIPAGEMIAECVYNHFHLFSSKFDIYKEYMEQDIAIPPFKAGDNIAATVDNINLRKDFGMDTEIVGKLMKGDVVEVASERYPIDDGYSWIQTNKGWAAYTPEWYRLTSSPVDPCAATKAELADVKTSYSTLSVANEKLTREARDYRKVIEAFEGTKAHYNEQVVKLEGEITLLKELQSVLNKELENRDKAIKKYRELNATLMAENQSVAELVKSKEDWSWHLGEVYRIIDSKIGLTNGLVKLFSKLSGVFSKSKLK